MTGRLRKYERGFSLVAAIFILVVLGFLAAIMVTVGEAERSTAVAAAQGARAYQAAQAGIEWGVYGALNNTAATCGAAPATPTTSAPVALAGSLSDFTVTVTCSYMQHQEAGVNGSTPPITPNQYKVFSISATATFGTFGSRDFFSRTLQVTATDAQ